MPGRTMTLTGWKAVLVLAVVVGVGGFRLKTAHTTIDTQGRASLEAWVRAEATRPILADTTGSLVDKGVALAKASSVTIQSLAVRGPLRNAVVRVELSSSSALPPGTPRVRYYHMRYSQVSGWTHHGSATAMDWYLAAF